MGTRISSTAQFYGWSKIRVGENCLICDDVLVNAWNSPSSDMCVEIGDFSLIGRRNFLNAGTLLSFGPYTLTGPDCHFLGADHRFDTPATPYVFSGTDDSGRIVIGANCWFGARVTVLKGVTVGRGAIIGAASVVTRDIPPYCMVVGSPARLIRTFDWKDNIWKPFDAELAGAGPSEEEYLDLLRKQAHRQRLPQEAVGLEAGDF